MAPIPQPSLPVAPLSLAVISNPQAGRNKKALPAVAALLRQHPQVRHYLATTPAEMASVLHQIRDNPPAVLALNGGDGSIALLLTLLLESPPEPFPLLALIAGGTTNMNANDIGIRDRPAAALAKLLAWCQRPDAARVRTRSLLQLQADAAPPHVGFFLGCGLIASAVDESRERRARARWPALAPPAMVISHITSLLCGKKFLTAPVTMAIDDGEHAMAPRPILTLFATTLDSLILGLRPFAGTAPSGYLHWGAIEQHIPHPLRTLPRFLSGRSHPLITAEQGFHRGMTQSLVLHSSDPYMVDGETYPLAAQLQISTTAALRFVKL